MPSLKELYEKAQATGKVEYDYFTGGGTSRPFNQTSIGFGDNDQPYIRLGYDPAVKFRSDDPTNTFNSVLAATRDTVRITRFLSDFPNGPLWLTKQTGLQLSNPDTSYKSANGTSTVLDILDGPRFYNPLGINTIAQVPAGVLGLHFTRHGLSPILGGSDDISGYKSQNKSPDGTFESRLKIYREKINSEDPVTLLSYKGGPNSFYGIGNTSINTYKDEFNLNTGITNKNYSKSTLPQQYLGFNPWSYDTIQTWGETQTKNKLIDTLSPDLAKYPLDFTGKENYLEYNVHNRVGVTSNINNIGSPNTVDSINVISITPRSVFYGLSNPATNPTNTAKSPKGSVPIYSGQYTQKEVQEKTNGNFGRDIIKFRIELLNNDLPIFGGEINTDVLAFRAYLDSLSDDINPTWKSFNYMGRGEDFYVYEKFSRKINFSFILFAHSKYEMPAIYTKLNYLMSAMAPDYNSKNQMRGTYAYLTIGDYIYQQPGVFTGMNISNLLDAPWEITLNEPENRKSSTDFKDKNQHEVPKYMKVTMNFNPIHNFLPKKNHRDQPHTATFITPNFRTRSS
jgi:hypothetical protein